MYTFDDSRHSRPSCWSIHPRLSNTKPRRFTSHQTTHPNTISPATTYTILAVSCQNQLGCEPCTRQNIAPEHHSSLNQHTMAIARPVRVLLFAAAILWCFFLYQVFRPSSGLRGPGERYVNFERDPNLDRSYSVSRNQVPSQSNQVGNYSYGRTRRGSCTDFRQICTRCRRY